MNAQSVICGKAAATQVTSAPIGEVNQPSSLRERLRSSTAALHARVDHSLSHLLRREHDGYASFLTASAAGLLPLERGLYEGGVSAILPDWAQRARSTVLLADLTMLSLPVPRLRTLRDKNLFRFEAYQFGVLYVLEGSRLGARAILRSRERSGQTGPTNYLSHGEGQPLWPLFLAQLEASDAAHQDQELAIAGATAAFEMFLCPDAALQ
jgi:heme oxygenase